jgi:hypothetical protein
MSSETQLLDSSAAPTGFTNDAPFKKKSKAKDPLGSALKALAGLGIVLCVLAMAMSFMSM